jgi:hypothetical protein
MATELKVQQDTSTKNPRTVLAPASSAGTLAAGKPAPTGDRTSLTNVPVPPAKQSGQIDSPLLPLNESVAGQSPTVPTTALAASVASHESAGAPAQDLAIRDMSTQKSSSAAAESAVTAPDPPPVPASSAPLSIQPNRIDPTSGLADTVIAVSQDTPNSKLQAGNSEIDSGYPTLTLSAMLLDTIAPTRSPEV